MKVITRYSCGNSKNRRERESFSGRAVTEDCFNIRKTGSGRRAYCLDNRVS